MSVGSLPSFGSVGLRSEPGKGTGVRLVFSSPSCPSRSVGIRDETRIPLVTTGCRDEGVSGGRQPTHKDTYGPFLYCLLEVNQSEDRGSVEAFDLIYLLLLHPGGRHTANPTEVEAETRRDGTERERQDVGTRRYGEWESETPWGLKSATSWDQSPS